MKCNANELEYCLIELFGQKMLYTDARIDRSTVPKGVFVYDLRHADEDWGDACEIAEHILVNHLGTVVSASEVKLESPIDNYKPYRLIDAERDMNYLDERMKIDEYVERFCGKETKQ